MNCNSLVEDFGKIIIILENGISLDEAFIILKYEKKGMGKCFALKVPKCPWHSEKSVQSRWENTLNQPLI